jgi:endonuclease YncB( thermonuclease family)
MGISFSFHRVTSRYLLALAATLCLAPCWADIITGQVVGVADGDTITVLDGSFREHKIRLDGIDAPEKAQPFGQRSKQSLSDLVYGRTVEVDTYKSDRYGRQVGKVLIQGTDVNLEQVSRGLAWHYKAYAHEQTSDDQVKYAAAEGAARSARRGLWLDATPTPPWKWRKERR